MNKFIEVTVSPAGEVSINAVGFKGADCEAATAYLEQALGAVGNKTKKPEYHQHSTLRQSQNLGS